MIIHNQFDVPLPPAEAWKTLLDIEEIVLCLPGAEIAEKVDERTYRGSLAIKLGPVALKFRANAELTNVDDVSRTACVKAQGRDEKGRGGVHAVMNFHLEPIGDAARVLVETEVKLTGSIAQYGRGSGMIEDLANHMVGEFATCLRSRLDKKRPSDVADTPVQADARSAEYRSNRPISGISLLFKLIKNAFRRWIRLPFRPS